MSIPTLAEEERIRHHTRTTPQLVGARMRIGSYRHDRHVFAAKLIVQFVASFLFDYSR